MSDFLSVLADQALPPERVSHWYCDRDGCDGEPHGEHWHWCGHPLRGPHDPSCRHARAQQVPTRGDWFVWMLLAGRGLGKSRAAAEWLVHNAWRESPAEWCTIARNAGDVRKNARDMTAGLVVIAERDGVLERYNRHEEDIYLKNGAVIHCLSADKPDRLRGFNLAGAWADELSSWRFAADTWDYGLMPALRAGAHPRVVVTTTPKPVPLLKRLVEEAKAEEEKPPHKRSKIITSGSTWDNAANLAANFISEMRSTYGGTRIGRQELEGELLFDISGALVSYEMIEEARLDDRATAEEQAGGFVRVVVAIDPAGSYGERSDETGIVVCAKGRDGHGYVLADLSCKKSPREWATVAANAYERFQADRVVAEKNMGHAMVEEVIRSVAPTLPFTPIQAVQGKRLRAEPITALYEQRRIHHVGSFPNLEDQLCTWEPESNHSPDRMDALVHGFTELGLARWGPTHAFMSMMRKQIDARQNGETPDRDATKLARVLDAKKSRAQRMVERQRRTCTHRWGRSACVFCGQEKEPA